MTILSHPRKTHPTEKAPLTSSLMLRLLPSPPHSLNQLLLRHLLPTRKIPRRNLRINLHPRIRRNQMCRNIISLQDGDTTLHDGVVLHITHADHVVDLGNTEPVEDVGHERLETHVFYTGDNFGGAEVFIGGVAAAFAEVVDEVSGGREGLGIDGSMKQWDEERTL